MIYVDIQDMRHKFIKCHQFERKSTVIKQNSTHTLNATHHQSRVSLFFIFIQIGSFCD